MESPLASWQVENFSSPAEFSPPISPSPLSPTLYSNAHNGDSVYIKSELSSASTSPSRAEIASSILHDLELESYQYSQYDRENEMKWTEESINLELFEDLEFEDFTFSTRPLTPDSQEFKNQEHLRQLDESPQPSPSTEFPAEAETFDELSAEFQDILAGLSVTSHVTNIEDGEVIQILGIPCTLNQIKINGLRIHPVVEDSEQQNNSSDDEESREGSSDAGNSMDIDDQSHTFDDFELQVIGLDGNESHAFSFSNASSPSSSSISSDEEIDVADHTCESILNALMVGDLNTAKSFVPVHMEMSLSQSSSDSVTSQKRGNRLPGQRVNSSKSGRCGSTGMKKPRLPSNTDKAQRKKEQNKTAATRYREKKKLQAAVVTVQEDELEKINNQLQGQRDDLHRQVLIYKELLRAVMTDRKRKQVVGRSVGGLKRMVN